MKPSTRKRIERLQRVTVDGEKGLAFVEEQANGSVLVTLQQHKNGIAEKVYAFKSESEVRKKIEELEESYNVIFWDII